LKKKIELIFNEEVLSISTENNNLYVELETGKAYGESKNVTLISGHWDGKSLKNKKYLYTKDSLTILSDNRSNKRSLIDLKIKPILRLRKKKEKAIIFNRFLLLYTIYKSLFQYLDHMKLFPQL